MQSWFKCFCFFGGDIILPCWVFPVESMKDLCMQEEHRHITKDEGHIVKRDEGEEVLKRRL